MVAAKEQAFHKRAVKRERKPKKLRAYEEVNDFRKPDGAKGNYFNAVKSC